MKIHVLHAMTVLSFGALVGCQSGRGDGKTAHEPKPASRIALFATTPGNVIVTNPGPAGNTGSGFVWVKWDSTQANLQNSAKWTLKKSTGTSNGPFFTEGKQSFSSGTYTITFSPCSIAGYTPPKTTKPIYVSQNKVSLVTVKYTH